MTVTAERFAQGLTYAEYKAQMTRNRERLEANESTVEISSDDLAFFASLPGPVHVLVLAEDWCGDVIANLPVLARLAADTMLDVRIFLRDQNLDLMQLYLKDGLHQSIPVFAFFDAEFQELGHWIERPASISVRQHAMMDELYASDPAFADVARDTALGQLPEAARDRLMQAFGAFREATRHEFDQEVVRELRELVSGAAHTQARAASGATSAPPLTAAGTAAAPAAVAPPRAPSRAAAGQPVKVRITYCAACGYEPQTLALAGALMHEFLYDLAAIELIPWHDGTFEVVVGADLVHSMMRDGGFPEHAAIIAAVRERLAA